MIGSTLKNLKEEIIEILLQKPASSKRIKTLLKERGINVTIQGIYKQLNTLLESEVVLKNKKEYIINNEWIKNVSRIIDVQEIELPEEGEKFTYKFNSLQNLDAHWKHIMSSFRKKFPKISIFSYCPHQIWNYVPTREKSVSEYTKDHEESGIFHYFTLGGKTDLDRKYRKKYTGNYYKIELLVINSIKRNIHASVLGDIVVTSKIEKSLAKKLDSTYLLNEQSEKKEILIIDTLSNQHNGTIVIERNKQNAEKLRKQISKPFYIR